MIEAAKQYHYSALHWARQFTAIDKYIDSLSWSLYSDALALYIRDREPTSDTNRRKSLRNSAAALRYRAHVNKYRMLNDPLRTNGISFGVMLDDLRIQLHERITQRHHEERFKSFIDEFIARRTKPQPNYASGGVQASGPELVAKSHGLTFNYGIRDEFPSRLEAYGEQLRKLKSDVEKYRNVGNYEQALDKLKTRKVSAWQIYFDELKQAIGGVVRAVKRMASPFRRCKTCPYSDGRCIKYRSCRPFYPDID
jgi:hypothetical protein